MKLKFDVSQKEYEIVRDILQAHLPAGCKAYVFGSRAKNTATNTSDLDLALEGGAPLEPRIISQLKDDFTESRLPYTVDVLDMNAISESFKEIVEGQKVKFPLAASAYTPRLRFPEFSGAWEERKLGEVAEINPATKELPESFVYIDLESVEQGILKYKKNILLYNAPSRAQRLLKKDDILFQTVRPYQRNNLFFCENDISVASTGYAQIRAIKNDSFFIYQYLHKDSFVEKVLYHCTGTSYPAINPTNLAKITLKLPTLPEQQKIAGFLAAVDGWLVGLKRRQKLQQSFKRGVMQRIFSQHLRFTDSNNNPFPDWQQKKLGEISEIITGKTPSTKEKSLWGGDILFITPTDIKEGKYQFSSARTVSQNSKMKILPNKSIMFTCIASIGKIAISMFPCITNQQINSIIPKKHFDNEFIYYALLNLTPKIKSTFAKTTLPIINKTDFSNFLILVPSLPEQQRIAEYLSSLDEAITTTARQIAAAEQFKNALLQQMFV